MFNLASVIRDRRFVVLLCSAAASVLIGFLLVSPDRALNVITFGGYWMMLALVATAAWVWWRSLKTEISVWSSGWKDQSGPVGLVLVCWVMLIVHDPFGFKILMDEAMLAGTAMSMHFEKIAIVPMRGHDIQGAFELLGGQLDKRPLLQPFLVSVIHDFTGYRPENGFVLNAGLTLVLLVLVYRAGVRLAGRGAGCCAVGLLTSLPLLAQNATGGGFEVLNLVMILAVFLAGVRFAEKRDSISMDALVVTTILLALTRYESVLFVFPVAGLIVWGWIQAGRPILGWVSAVSPMMLVPYALHNKVFSVRESSWEMASLGDFDTPFSVRYVTDNIAHAMAFFFDTTGEHSNSLVVAVLGCIAVPFVILLLLKLVRQPAQARPVEAAWAAISLGFIAHTSLMMLYFWGRFDDPVIRRLSLPLNLFLVLSIVVVAAQVPGKRRKWMGLAGLIGIGFFSYSLPSMARQDYSLDYYVARETAWRREFIAAHPEKDYLVVDPNSIEWIIHQVSSTPIKRAVDDPDIMRFNWRNKIFGEMYVFQRYQIEPATGEVVLPEEYDVGSAYVLEPVWERRFTPFTLSRISRIAEIQEGESRIQSTERSTFTEMTPEEISAARKAYMENFIKLLP